MVYIASGIDLNGNNGNNDDFDRLSRELFWEVEQQLIMHKLAKDYYRFRAFWLQSLPLLLITSLITIVGFIQYGQYNGSIGFDLVDETEYAESNQWLALSVGILGLLSTLITSLIITTRYQSQHDIHAMAERTLLKVCQSVRFPERLPGDDGTKLAQHIHKQNAIFMTITCISADIPPKIVQAFQELEHVMCTKPYTFRAIQYERFYYFLWKMYTKKSYLWPWKIPEINVSTGVLGEIIEDEYTKYNIGLEALTKRSDSSFSIRAKKKRSRRSSMRRSSTRSPTRSPTRSSRRISCDEDQVVRLLHSSASTTLASAAVEV